MDENPTRFKLVLMPRDHLKTTVCTISGNVQRIVKDPEERILIANENGVNASRMLGAIKSHAESNKVFRALYSSIIPKDFRKDWNSESIKFRRQGTYPEPTVDSIGMTGTMTSRHYTHVCVDDPISEEAVKSQAVMQDTITRIDKIHSLLVKPEESTFWIIATRWAYNDVVSFFMKKLGHRFAKFIRSVTEDGELIFPEHISFETLADIRNTMGEYSYSCLYMNNPRDPSRQDFDTKDLRWWRWSLDGRDIVLIDDSNEIVEIVPLSKLDITTTVDPAMSERVSSDRNAVVTTGVTPKGNAIVLEAWVKRCNPLQLIEHIISVIVRWHPRAIGIEGVAYQKAIKYFLKQELNRRGLYANIVEIKSTSQKEVRIRGLQPIVATGRLYIQPTMFVLRDEMADFPLGDFDDCLDALSMHQQLWRGIMSAERWERYKQSEQRLLRTIARGGYEAEDEDKNDLDPDDYPKEQWGEAWEMPA